MRVVGRILAGVVFLGIGVWLGKTRPHLFGTMTREEVRAQINRLWAATDRELAEAVEKLKRFNGNGT